jgi:predicted amidohydrolase YtcJ
MWRDIMAFGFFKKSETADAIFMGGKVFTQNSELPWAEAVACKDGLVLAVGDYEDLSEFEGKNTDIVDLEGGFMLPGYIDACGHPVMKAFQDSCLFLTDGGLEDVMTQISDYTAANEDIETVFAYGYDENILKDIESERVRALLDEACPDKPAVVLAKSGFHCFINTAALDIVKAAAEEDDVNAITISYILSVLEPIDINTIPEAVPEIMGKYCDRGFTSIFDCGAPDPFASLYQNFMVHLYQEEMLKQRFYGSLLVTRDANPRGVMNRLSQLRTNCAELNGHIGFKTLKLLLEGDEENLSISEDVLGELCIEAGDKGFDVHIDALGEDAIDAALEAMSAARSAGYKKNALVLAHDETADPQELKDNCYHLDITETVCTLTPDNDWLCIENAKSVEEAVEMLTVNAALQLGISSEFGTIERGKHADFVIFDENPLACRTLADFKKLHSAMTVIDGNVVYDAEEDDMSQWFSMLTMQQY